LKTVPLIGYTDKLSGRPGDQINFMISSQNKSDFTAQLFRSVNADPNPKGQGIVEYACDDLFQKQSFSSRKQKFHPGSYGITEQPLKMSFADNVSFSVTVYPTLRTSSPSIIN
jgi:N,N-dimethylformamidase